MPRAVLVLSAIMFATVATGCIEVNLPDETPGAAPAPARAPAMQPYHDERSETMGADGCGWYGYEAGAPFRLTYSLTVRDGSMGVYVMDYAERDAFCNGHRFRYYTGHESATRATESTDLAPGKYAVGVRCNNYFDPCPYDLTVDLTGR